MKRFAALLTVALILLVSCGKADVTIRTDLENTRAFAPEMTSATTVMTAATSEDGLMLFVLNSSSKTFHISEECRHVKGMSEKNKIIIASSGVEDMMSRGYSPCSTCFGNIETD